MRPTCWRSRLVHLTSRDVPRVTLLPTQHKSPGKTRRFCSDTQAPALATLGVCCTQLTSTGNVRHILPIPDTTVSRPRSCLTVALGGPAHCKLPVNQQGKQRISARRGQGKREAEYDVTSGLWARGAQGWRKDFHCTPNRVRDQSCF